jgi:hypothetical protein
MIPPCLASRSRSRKKNEDEQDSLTRIAIVNSDKCKPKKCRQECKNTCPVVRMGKMCIEVKPTDKVRSKKRREREKERERERNERITRRDCKPLSFVTVGLFLM